MNTTFFAHVAAEVIVIGGISFHFQKQISQLKSEITVIKNQMDQMAGVMQQQHDALMFLTGKAPHPTQQPPQKPSQQKLQTPLIETTTTEPDKDSTLDQLDDEIELDLQDLGKQVSDFSEVENSDQEINEDDSDDSDESEDSDDGGVRSDTSQLSSSDDENRELTINRLSSDETLPPTPQTPQTPQEMHCENGKCSLKPKNLLDESDQPVDLQTPINFIPN